ncbi:hypothetical protein [Actinomadura rubrisoli]|uniref:Uncharacterized protein n=1 Tax=Actinomadura rubrisoli TaxID=2530368 RepID=A0A4R5CCF1_9ACTN|nr:hypothetical protein [Actinomadura rubrisoli]TDD97668.1 hypothetical protein E1298_01135 [Actinomadura rubrisoli]
MNSEVALTNVVSVVALAGSLGALRYARRSAQATERQGQEAARAVVEAQRATEVNQATALRQARHAAMSASPSVTVVIDSSQHGPAVLANSWGEDAEVSPPPRRLDPIGTHRLHYLGMRYRGLLRNDSVRPIFVLADHGFFIAGETDLRDAPLSAPSTVDGHIAMIGPEGEALFEWFGHITVIDWLELARAGSGTEDARGVRAPFTEIRVNYAGDQDFGIPSLKITLALERHPVFIPTFQEGEETTTLQLLGEDGGVGCSITKSHPRLPRTFEDIGKELYLR